MPTLNRSRLLLAVVCSMIPTAVEAQQPAQTPQVSQAPQTPPGKASLPASKSPKAPPSKTVTAWRSKVIAHLNARKRAFSAGAAGTSTIGFTIDRSGKILSARLITSSGNTALDKEALALAQRASPLPAPPADLTGATLSLRAPIRFKK
jgi:protein TonB